MAEYKITCSSTCDLTAEHLKALDVGFLKFHYVLDGVEYPDDLYASCTPQQFYTRIKTGALPTTSQTTPEEVIALIEPLLQQGYDVLHIEFSSGLSGSYNSAVSAQKALLQKYPERKFTVVDSLAASSGYGLLVDKAVRLKNSGMSIDELTAWLEENKLRLRHWFFTTNLTHFKRGGRVSGAAAMFGSMLNICPVLDVNSQGKLIVRKKVIGKKKAIKAMVDIMTEQAENGENYSEKCYISNSMVLDDALLVASGAQTAFPKMNGRVLINNIGTVIGSHTGDGTVALFFFSKDKRGI